MYFRRFMIHYDSYLCVHVRMSLDLSTSSLSNSLPGLQSLETGPLAVSAITDDSTNEVVADVKSFDDTGQNVIPGTMKRVQSDAMLNAAEEASKVLGSSRRSSDDEYLEEVLTRLGCATALDCSFTDEDAVKKVCLFLLLKMTYPDVIFSRFCLPLGFLCLLSS